MSESPHRASREVFWLKGNEEGIGAWNAVLRGVPRMRHWTVEELMARVNTAEGIDLDWRNYLRERYDV